MKLSALQWSCYTLEHLIPLLSGSTHQADNQDLPELDQGRKSGLLYTTGLGCRDLEGKRT